jgi:alkylation response protein AidB-like acyl-CoA dehydrogenase
MGLTNITKFTSKAGKMEFDWTDEQRAYRREIRDFLDANLPENWAEISRRGVAAPEQVEFSRSFCPKLAEAGFLIRHWPSEYGGADGGPWEHFILGEEMMRAGEPRGPQYMNVNWLGPVLMKYGTEAQKAEHLQRIAQGQVIWCQGYSEPGAGTDLAGLKTRAVRVGDDYVINGSKIWTSYAYVADYCFLLARTGSERKEISIFLMPMDLKGITVRPVPALVEFGHLNEIFLDDVRLPASAMVGEPGKAWEIISYALSYERVGIPRYELGQLVLDRAVSILKAQGRFDDPLVRAAAGRVLSKLEAARLLTYKVVDQRAKGAAPSIDANVARVAGGQATIELLDFIAEYLAGETIDGDVELQLFFRSHISHTIAAGTYEIQLDQIAARALELPRGR